MALNRKFRCYVLEKVDSVSAAEASQRLSARHDFQMPEYSYFIDIVKSKLCYIILIRVPTPIIQN